MFSICPMAAETTSVGRTGRASSLVLEEEDEDEDEEDGLVRRSSE